MKPTFFKGVALGAATSTLVLAATAALAGTGVGGIFNLGQTNSVDATSTLTGSVDTNPQLHVINGGNGPAVRGLSIQGRGVFGRHGGTTGTLPGVEGSTASTDPNAIGLQGSLAPNADSSGIAVRGLGTNGTGVYGMGRRGVIGSSSSGTGVAGIGGGYGVEGYGSTGVQGRSQDGRGVVGWSTTGTGVQAISDTDNGLYAKSNVTEPGKAALRAENFSGPAAILWGDTQVAGNLLFTGSSTAQQHMIAGDYGKCPLGLVAAAAKVNASPAFSSSFATLPDSFQCNSNGSEGGVMAKRLGTGDYEVRIPGASGKLVAVGNVRSTGSEDDYLMIEEVTGSLGRHFRVRIRDDDGGFDDVPFSIVAISY